MFNIFKDTIVYIINTLIHNAPYLLLGILIASALKVYIDPDKFKSFLIRKANVSIPGSVAFGALTPFCACGTMAVVISMLTTALPWGPIMAFLTSSPLMSPDGFIFISGVISFEFAVALTLASIFIGLASGYITHFIEKNTHFLENQARFTDNSITSSCNCTSEMEACACDEKEMNIPDGSMAISCCSGEITVVPNTSFLARFKLKELLDTIVDIGFKKVLLFFTIFAGIGYLINQFVPASIITSLFSANNIFAVPLSAVIGLPLYVSGASALPVINSLMHAGASGGAMLAFLITGPGTSAGVIAGIATIMKKRALLLYVAYILFGGIICGYAYDLYILLSK